MTRHNSGHRVPVCTPVLLVIMQTTASYSLQSSSFQVASHSVKGSNYVDSFISGTQDVNKTPHCASSKALVPRLPTKCTQPLFHTHCLLPQPKILQNEIEQGQIILFLQLL